MKFGALAISVALVIGFVAIVPSLAAVNVCCPQVAQNDGRIAVLLQGKSVPGALVEFTPFKGGQTISLATDRDGIATTKNLQPGHYFLIASHDEGESKRIEVEVTDIAGVSTLFLNLVPDPDIPAELAQGKQIQKFAGIVTDLTGAVIPGARIRILKRVEGRPLALHLKVDEAGRFRGNLEEGSYVALVSAAAFKTSVVPFEIRKNGSGDLQIQLQIAQELPTT